MIFRWSLMIAALLLYQMDSDKQLSAMAFNYVICCRKPNVTTFNGVDKCMDVKLHHQIDKVLPGNKSQMLQKHTVHTFYIFYDKVNCTNSALELSGSVDSKQNIHLFETNESWTKLNKSISLQGEFCLKQITEENSQIFVCKRLESMNDSNSARSYVHNMARTIILVGMAISLPFLFLTIFTYALIKELQNIHGMFLMFITMMILCNNIITILRYFDQENPILQYFQQYTTVSIHFWLHIVCFDFWWSFNNKWSIFNNENQNKKKTLILSSIIVFTGTLIFVLITNMGFSNKSALTINSRLMYRNLPLDVLLLVCILMLLHSLINIINQMRDLNKSAGFNNVTTMNDNEKKYTICIKLFMIIFIIVLNWLTQIISWLFDVKYELLLLPIDIVNTGLGLLIFVIFVCKKKIFILFKENLVHITT